MLGHWNPSTVSHEQEKISWLLSLTLSDPMVSRTFSGTSKVRPLPCAADTMVSATTWCEVCSREAANRSALSGTASGLGGPGNKGHGRSKYQRTWCCCDQHRQCPDGIVRIYPSGASDEKCHRQENKREAVGHPNEWSLGCLGRADHTDDAGICAFGCGRRRPHLQCLTRIDRAARCRFTGPPRDRNGFYRYRRFINQCTRTS